MERDAVGKRIDRLQQEILISASGPDGGLRKLRTHGYTEKKNLFVRSRLA